MASVHSHSPSVVVKSKIVGEALAGGPGVAFPFACVFAFAVGFAVGFAVAFIIGRDVEVTRHGGTNFSNLAEDAT